jgi:hypothetical protein
MVKIVKTRAKPRNPEDSYAGLGLVPAPGSEVFTRWGTNPWTVTLASADGTWARVEQYRPGTKFDPKTGGRFEHNRVCTRTVDLREVWPVEIGDDED